MKTDTKKLPQVKKMSVSHENEISELTSSSQKDLDNLLSAIDAAGLQEFMEYIRSPWRMLLPNFIAGIARGFGALVGATIVIALIGWILSTLIDLPLIGTKIEPYVERVQTEFRKYTEATNYRQNFERMESTLESIDNTLKNRGNQ